MHRLSLVAPPIHTVEDVKKLALSVRLWTKNTPQRMVFYQLKHPVHQWSEIINDHRLLVQSNYGFADIILPIFPTWVEPQDLVRTPLDEKTITRLVHQFQAEGWVAYCRWAAEEMMPIIAHLKNTDTEEYTTRALLEDFCHEAHSNIVREEVAHLDQTYLEAGDSPNIEREKRIATLRFELGESVQAHKVILIKILENLPSVLALHPDLARIERLCRLLLKSMQMPVMDTLGRLLLAQALDHALEVISFVSSDDDRSLWVEGVREVLQDLYSEYSTDEVDAFVIEGVDSRNTKKICNVFKNRFRERWQQMTASRQKVPEGKLWNPILTKLLRND